MDRLTGKTYDCYVEVENTEAAQSLVNTKNTLTSITTLYDRIPVVEMSSLDKLLHEMFPKARNLKFVGGWPEARYPDDPFENGFKTLVTHEEMSTAVRYAESPQRVSMVTQAIRVITIC